jgi:hypothetical protein
MGQTSRPWRIHELAQDFRRKDVLALRTPSAADDFRRPVHLVGSGDSARGSPRSVLPKATSTAPTGGWPSRTPQRPPSRGSRECV